jgi:RNA polymerase sigma-70 factor (ECF subfamily)
MMNELFSYRFFLLKVAKNNLSPTMHSWAEDIVQDAFLKASKNTHAYDEGKGKLSNWLAHMTVNLCRDFAKKKVNSEVCCNEIFTVTSDSDWNSSNVEPPNLRKYYNQLNPRYKKVLILKYTFKLSAKEMAKHLGIPATSVPVLTRRARLSLADIMQKNNSNISTAA